MGKVINLFKGEIMMPTVFDIALAFLNIEPMSNKKLQKLCYYAQAWYLALNNEPLFNERFEAWIHGPVCPDLYHNYKHNGYRIIRTNETTSEEMRKDPYLMDFINNIYAMYGDMTGDELEALTHKELPWINARRGLQDWESSNNEVSMHDMMNYYKEIQGE